MANYSRQSIDNWWRDRDVRPEPQRYKNPSYDDNPYLPLPVEQEETQEYGLEYIERPQAREQYSEHPSYPRHVQQRIEEIPVGVQMRQQMQQPSRTQLQQGPYAGKGPRQYKRPDDRIMEDINDALLRNSWIDATDVDIRCDNGEVTVAGSVLDRQMKRRVIELAEDTPGVVNVISHLRVQNRQ